MGRHKAVPKHQIAVRSAFQRELQGDLSFGFEADHHRSSRYLSRNIKRILRFHQKNAIATKTSNLQGVASRKSDNVAFSQNTRPTQSLGRASSNLSFSDAERAAPKQYDDFPTFADYVKDKDVNVYVSSFKVKRELPLGQSELLLNITNLKGKLSANATSTHESRREYTSRCIVSVSLFRQNTERLLPLGEQRRGCTLITDPSCNDVKVNLEKPFKFGIEMSLGTFYQIEIQLLRLEDTSPLWPPVPVTTRQVKIPLSPIRKRQLEISFEGLLATYTTLPLHKRTTECLDLMYAVRGATFKTRHKLEISVDCIVARRQPAAQTANRSSDTNTTSRRVRLPTSKARELANIVTKAAEHTRMITTYTLASTKDKSVASEWRQLSFQGCHCPFCFRQHADFDNIVALRFHLITAHPSHNFILQELKSNKRERETITYSFKVSNANRKADKIIARWPLTWTAPPAPFDIHTYVNGDESWFGTKPAPAIKAPIVTIENPIIALRRQHAGFLPVQHVSEIPVRQHKKYPIVPTKTRDKLPLFTSVTHRQLQPDELLSESDDDVDESWLRDKHAQQIMDMTHLPLEERLLQIRWNDHVRREGLPHTFYLSDCFVRWVRRDREWLRESRERLRLYHRFENGLRERGVISDVVARGCWGILYGKGSSGEKEVTNQTEATGS